MTQARNLSSGVQVKAIEINPSELSKNEITNINEQWAIDECKKRDILHSSMSGYGISVGKEAINDSSMLLLHHFINFKTYAADQCSNYGLVEWLRQETYDAINSGELIGVHESQKMVKVKYRSMFWVISGLNEEDLKGTVNVDKNKLTLLGIKPSADEDVRYFHTHSSQSTYVSIHILNRLSTRALSVFIDKGLMLGKNICQFIMEALDSAKVECSLGEDKVKLSYHGLNLIAIDSSKGRKLITVLS